MVTTGIGWVVMADEIVTTAAGLVVMGASDNGCGDDTRWCGKVVGCGLSLAASDLAVFCPVLTVVLS